MPCLKNVLPLHLPRNERRQMFENILLNLADQWINTDSEQKREKLKEKIEELRKEVVATKLLRRIQMSFIRDVYEWQSMPFTEEYLKSFFFNYSDSSDDSEQELQDEEPF